MTKASINSVGSIKGIPNRKWFFFTILYLFVDYMRPQDIWPFLGLLRPGVITISILTIYILFTGSITLSDSKQTRLIWAFILLLFLHVPFAQNNYFAYITTTSMLKFMPFILSVIILVNSIDRLKKIISINILLMFYISLYSIYHQGVGSGNWFADENDFALYINTIMPFCVAMFLHEDSKIKKLFYGATIITGVISIFVSFSRGGFVGLIAIFSVAWLISRHKVRMSFLIGLAAFAFFAYTSQEYRGEMSTITDTQSGTIHVRIITWKAAWDMFIDNPLGVGGHNFPVRFQEYQSEEFTRGMWGRTAHSLWFTLIPELGIPGIIIYFMLLWINLKELLFLTRLKYEGNPDLLYIHTLSLAFLASAAGFFASATGLSVLYYPHFWYLTALLVATKKVAESRLEAFSSDVEDRNKVSQGAIPLA